MSYWQSEAGFDDHLRWRIGTSRWTEMEQKYLEAEPDYQLMPVMFRLGHWLTILAFVLSALMRRYTAHVASFCFYEMVGKFLGLSFDRPIRSRSSSISSASSLEMMPSSSASRVCAQTPHILRHLFGEACADDACQERHSTYAHDGSERHRLVSLPR